MRPLAILRRLDAWALRDGTPHVQAVFRIAFGAFLLVYWGLRLPDVPLLFSDQGLVIHGLGPGWPMWVYPLFQPPPAGVAWAIYALMLASLALLTLGLWMRVAALTAAVLTVYYWGLSLHLFPTSFDRLFLFVLAVLAISGADRALSLRQKLRHGSWTAWEPVCVLPQRLLMLQILATYLGVGWQKVVLPDWQGGEILTYSFLGPWGTAPAYWMVRLNLPLWFYDASVFLITAFEVALPVGLAWRRTRWWFVAGAAVFHILITVLLAIWWFLVLLPAYIVLWEPEEVTEALRRRVPALVPPAPAP